MASRFSLVNFLAHLLIVCQAVFSTKKPESQKLDLSSPSSSVPVARGHLPAAQRIVEKATTELEPNLENKALRTRTNWNMKTYMHRFSESHCDTFVQARITHYQTLADYPFPAIAQSSAIGSIRHGTWFINCLDICPNAGKSTNFQLESISPVRSLKKFHLSTQPGVSPKWLVYVAFHRSSAALWLGVLEVCSLVKSSRMAASMLSEFCQMI